MPTVTRKSSRSATVSPRTRAVWGVLLAAMTGVGGLLYIADRSPGTALGGISLPPLLAPGGVSSVEVVLNTTAKLDTQRWKSIVIHHSGSPVGTPESLDDQARAAGLKGLGYHFVIGNGNGMDDGRIHVGRRWLDQLPGAHAAGRDAEWYNQHSIAICLVGDGNHGQFTETQMRRLVQLVDTLTRELNIPKDKVILHSAIARTTDPGRLFPEAAFREELSARR